MKLVSKRLQAVCSHLLPAAVAASPQVASAASTASIPDIDVFVSLSSVDSYLGFDAIVRKLRGCRVHWHVCRVASGVGMLGGVPKEPLRQAYHLAVNKAYAAELGLPLGLPLDPSADTSCLDQVMTFAARHQSPSVVETLLRRCFAAVFDPSARGSSEPAASAAQRLLEEAGGDAKAFASFDVSKALEEERLAQDAAGVWTTPYIVDRETGEAFVGETTLDLVLLRLQRRGYVLPPPQPTPQPAPSIVTDGGRQAPVPLEVYIDLKSPYAFLAIEPTYALEEDFNVQLIWKPFLLDIYSFLGSAEVGARDNKVKEGSNKRSPKQWQAIKYAYANCRRYAEERQPPITLYGTKKIWNTTLVSAAMLFADDAGLLRPFQQRVWPKFWRRELEAEDVSEVLEMLRATGVPTTGFEEFAAGAGLQRLRKIQEDARSKGVFGVPSYFLNGESFFGREHLPLLRRRLAAAGLAKRQGPGVLESPYLWTRNELFAGF